MQSNKDPFNSLNCLFLIFFTLKVTNLTDWSWFFVFLPLLIDIFQNVLIDILAKSKKD